MNKTTINHKSISLREINIDDQSAGIKFPFQSINCTKINFLSK